MKTPGTVVGGVRPCGGAGGNGSATAFANEPIAAGGQKGGSARLSLPAMGGFVAARFAVGADVAATKTSTTTMIFAVAFVSPLQLIELEPAVGTYLAPEVCRCVLPVLVPFTTESGN